MNFNCSFIGTTVRKPYFQSNYIKFTWYIDNHEISVCLQLFICVVGVCCDLLSCFLYALVCLVCVSWLILIGWAVLLCRDLKLGTLTSVSHFSHFTYNNCHCWNQSTWFISLLSQKHGLSSSEWNCKPLTSTLCSPHGFIAGPGNNIWLLPPAVDQSQTGL